MVTLEDLLHRTQGKSVADLQMMYEDLVDARTMFRESVKNYILAAIPDWANEDTPYECDIFVEMYNSVGEPWIRNNITAIWRDEYGYLMLLIDDGEQLVDYLHDEELMQLIDKLELEP